jgi:hypothetical protein
MKVILGLLLALRLPGCGPLRVDYTTAPNSPACCAGCTPLVQVQALQVLHYPHAVLAPLGLRVKNTSQRAVTVAPSLLRLHSNKLHYLLEHTAVWLADKGQNEYSNVPVSLPAGDSCVVQAFFVDAAFEGSIQDLRAYQGEEVVTVSLHDFMQQLGATCRVSEYRYVHAMK